MHNTHCAVVIALNLASMNAQAAFLGAGADVTSLFFRFERPKETEALKQLVTEVPERISSSKGAPHSECTPEQQDVVVHDAAEESDAPPHVQQDDVLESLPPVNGPDDPDVLATTESSASAQQNNAQLQASLPDVPHAACDSEVVVDESVPAPLPKPRLILCCGGEDSDGSCATAYVVKHQDGRVDDEDVQWHLSVGVLSKSGTLRQLTSLLEQIYMSSIVDNSKNIADVSKAPVSQGQQTSDDAELLAALHKFIGQLRTSEVHLTGSVQIAMPSIDLSTLNAKDDDLLSVLESTVHEWTVVLQDVKQAEAEKSAQGDGPLDEIHFWRERNNVLGGLHEQINHGTSQAILEYVPCSVVSGVSLCLDLVPAHSNIWCDCRYLDRFSADRSLLANLRNHVTELSKLGMEARDNVKFLTTLERHFKAISHGPLEGTRLQYLY